MGLEVRRVSMSFMWPIGETWPGFVNPFWVECRKCGAGDKDCGRCHGAEVDPDVQTLFDAWEAMETDPPAGEGWQMWETVGEGSPVSPVCETPEKLAEYMTENPWSIHKATYEQWLRMIACGYAPSMVISGGVCYPGVIAAADNV
jgi:hypothetical protein